jgi:hypothetical protein
MTQDLIIGNWYLIEDTPEEKIFKRNNAVLIAKWNVRKKKYDLHFKLG